MAGKTLRIVDLGSDVGRAAAGYASYIGNPKNPFDRAKDRIDAISIGRAAHYEVMMEADAKSGRMLESIRASGIKIAVQKKAGILPYGGLGEIGEESASHVHLHMCTGGFSQPAAQALVEGAARILQQKGVLFLSADYTFDWKKRAGSELFEYVGGIVAKNLQAAFASCFNLQRKEWDARGAIMLPAAVEIAGSFGKWEGNDAKLCVEKPAEFFARFSSFADSGESFFIAVKN